MDELQLTLLIELIRLDVVKSGGRCTFPFSQSLDPVATILEGQGGGVCQALTNRWIADHANGDSIWNRLYQTVNNKEQINDGELRRIIREQGAAGDNARAQIPYNEMWLAVQGVIPFQSAMVNAYQFEGLDDQPADLARVIVQAIADSTSTDGHYLNVSLFGDGAHAVGVFIGQPDLLYFDANLGEFWFSDRKKFAPWLLRTWSHLRKVKYYKYKYYILTAYAKKARAF